MSIQSSRQKHPRENGVGAGKKNRRGVETSADEGVHSKTDDRGIAEMRRSFGEARASPEDLACRIDPLKRLEAVRQLV